MEEGQTNLDRQAWLLFLLPRLQHPWHPETNIIASYRYYATTVTARHIRSLLLVREQQQRQQQWRSRLAKHSGPKTEQSYDFMLV